MFKRKRIIISFLVSMTVLTGCGSKDKMDFYEDTLSTSLSEEVGDVALHSKKKQIIENLGTPDFVEKEKTSKSTYYKYGDTESDTDLEIQIVKGQVNRYSFSSDAYQTAKGITKGVSKNEVIREYGDRYYEREDSGSTIIGYFDKTKKVNIEFTLNDKERVKGIMVTEIES